MTRVKNSVYFSVSLQNEEKDQLDAAAAAAGLPRNRFVRNWIKTLPIPKSKKA